MKKSIGIVLLQVAIVCGLSVAGNSDGSIGSNNSLNPFLSSSTSGSSSTASSILETYLQTFPINEQQNVFTTYHASARHHPTSTMSVEKEKTTTSFSPPSTNAATESSQQFSSNANTLIPFVIATGASVSAGSLPTTAMNLSENPEQPVLIPSGPILLGCGPNNREGIGIQKALDWLREKRVSDYGWENDTHMVILAKEVKSSRKLVFLAAEMPCQSQHPTHQISNFLSSHPLIY